MPTYARLELADRSTPFARLEGDLAHLLDGAPWANGRETSQIVRVADARLLAPVAPSKVICVGRNYVAHARELGHDLPVEPLLFFKPPSAIIAHGDSIVLPEVSQRVDHEAELGVVIGRRARGVAESEALDCVFGYTCVNDVTARDLQKKDGQWARAKGFDTFCPVGPVVVTGLEPQRLRVRGLVNGQTRQDGQTSDMIFTVAVVVAYISRIMTLEPGDLIATGTPEGVGPLADGDRVEVQIDGIGTLSCSVKKPGS